MPWHRSISWNRRTRRRWTRKPNCRVSPERKLRRQMFHTQSSRPPDCGGTNLAIQSEGTSVLWIVRNNIPPPRDRLACAMSPLMKWAISVFGVCRCRTAGRCTASCSAYHRTVFHPIRVVGPTRHVIPARSNVASESRPTLSCRLLSAHKVTSAPSAFILFSKDATKRSAPPATAAPITWTICTVPILCSTHTD